MPRISVEDKAFLHTFMEFSQNTVPNREQLKTIPKTTASTDRLPRIKHHSTSQNIAGNKKPLPAFSPQSPLKIVLDFSCHPWYHSVLNRTYSNTSRDITNKLC